MRRPNGKMTGSKIIPFIASVLWTHEEHRQVNYFVKRIIKLFIDCISIDFPKKEIATLLVSQQINDIVYIRQSPLVCLI